MGAHKDQSNGQGPGSVSLAALPPSAHGPGSNRGWGIVRTALALTTATGLIAFSIWAAVLYNSKLVSLQNRVDKLETQIDVYIQNYIEEHMDNFIQQVSGTSLNFNSKLFKNKKLSTFIYTCFFNLITYFYLRNFLT